MTVTQASHQPDKISDEITDQLHKCNVDEDEQVCSKQWDVCRRSVQEERTLGLYLQLSEFRYNFARMKMYASEAIINVDA